MDEITLYARQNYIQNETWFEISRNDGYILVVNSYGKLRKLFTDGGYIDLDVGGVVESSNKETTDAKV